MSYRDPTEFGTVALVMGGTSAEREVSLDGGQAVLQALRNKGIDVVPVDGIASLMTLIGAGRVDRVFNLLHGRGGEDGTLQGALDCAGVPYTGSGVLGSALSMDKVRSKWVFSSCGLPTPEFEVVKTGAMPAMAFPMVIKPIREGSSVGIHLVRQSDDWQQAFNDAIKHDLVMAEQYIDGEEFTVAVLHGRALPPIQIVAANQFYDYESKYQSDQTDYLCPAPLTEDQTDLICRLAVEAFDSVACHGWGRVDLMRDKQGSFWILEVNTTPGMTSHSLVPKAAAAAGIEFEELVLRILETSLPKATEGRL
ncbi:MAG: D-alanine--D-alanine ligase B [Lysobacteraceae bacterium]|nr:MAG: D-alanine--D-alanine ligase B [Xanthomonadaceae bacterium]